ncbi:MAG: hypothetical protein KC503_17775 [Myxococcales bacterium]|nr:hypothetical protein [Myxococcales bacterium]
MSTQNKRSPLLLLLSLALGCATLVVACAKRKEAPARQVSSTKTAASPGAVGGMAKEEGKAAAAADEDQAAKGRRGKKRPRKALESRFAARLDGKDRAGGGKPKPEQKADSAEQPDQAPTRSWFPETFLFKPLLVTDAQGKAQITVRVPDRLTTWRVLALAHSRSGEQAGTVSSFLGTLPIYVEPVVPKRLRAGDVVTLPINVVNTTDKAVKAALALSVSGAQLAGGSGAVDLAAKRSVVRKATLTTTTPGAVRLLAKLGGADAVVRSIEVSARGRPVTRRVSGTLAAPRTITLQRAAGANLAVGQVRLQVYPGALALLRSELTASSERSYDLADDAFALLLAGRAPAFLKTLGDKPKKGDDQLLRDLAIVATQRALRRARVLTMTSATLLAQAAAAHPDSPVLERLAKRAADHIERKQSPDGTCAGATGWSLQRLLVATAECVTAARGRRRVAMRAAGAFERHGERIKDPYTAAAVLLSGAASNVLEAKLRKVIVAAIKTRKDGSKIVAVPKGVERADGERPTDVEATALAALALEGAQSKGVLADLGAAVLSGYSPGYGWGDGRANLICLRAAMVLFRDPVPANVRVTLERDGKAVAEQALTRDKVREVLVLSAAAGTSGGAQTWRVVATPNVAGLGFALTLVDRVPWKAHKGGAIELRVTAPKAPRVGAAAEIKLNATAPAGRPLRVRLALPAGVQVDRAHLDRLVRSGTLTRYAVTDAQVDLFAPSLQPAKILNVALRVIPTLAGTIHSGPASLKVGSVERFVPPTAWTIK